MIFAVNPFQVTLGIVVVLVLVPIAFWVLQALARGARRLGRRR